MIDKTNNDDQVIINVLQTEIEKRNKAIKMLMRKIEFNSLDIYDDDDDDDEDDVPKNVNKLNTNHVTNIGEQTNNHNCNNTITNNTINNTQNIILNYKDTDMTHLTAKDYRQIIVRKLNCIP